MVRPGILLRHVPRNARHVEAGGVAFVCNASANLTGHVSSQRGGTTGLVRVYAGKNREGRFGIVEDDEGTYGTE